MRTCQSVSLAIIVTFAGACGGGDGAAESSGIDSSKIVTSLSESEGTGLCEWAADVQGGGGTSHECGDGVSIEVQTTAECMESFAALQSCELTVGQFEACSLALADNPCSFGGQACAPLFDCL